MVLSGVGLLRLGILSEDWTCYTRFVMGEALLLSKHAAYTD